MEPVEKNIPILLILYWKVLHFGNSNSASANPHLKPITHLNIPRDSD
jgi:hypothetical protein